MPTTLDDLRRREPDARTLVADDAIKTAQLDLALPPLSGPFAVLHYAVQARAVSRSVALPGSYLGFEDGEGVEQLIPVQADLLRLGRSIGAEIRIEDIRVSRRHAILSRYADQMRVLDDASSTGTFVNGVSIVATTLTDGDVIRLGPVVFTYTIVR